MQSLSESKKAMGLLERLSTSRSMSKCALGMAGVVVDTLTSGWLIPTSGCNSVPVSEELGIPFNEIICLSLPEQNH